MVRVTVKNLLGAAALCALVVAVPGGVSAQTLTESLAAAYDNNPSLNVARSQLRGIDENIAIARSGNRPELAGAFSQAFQTTRTVGPTRLPAITRNRGSVANTSTFRLTLTQPLFAGFAVRNTIRQAEAAVRAQRASLQSTEQDILFDTATAFSDVIQNRAIVGLRRQDVSFLVEQVRAANDRFEVGEGTRTDVSQAEARRAQSESLLNFAIANRETAEAQYRELTGLTARNLRDNLNEARFVPSKLDDALAIGQRNHPLIISALHNVDTNVFNVAAIEGGLLPSVNLQGQAQSVFGGDGGLRQTDSASVSLNVNIPIYQAGRVSAQVRQAKEELGTARIQVDLIRDNVRRAIASAYANYLAASRSIFTAQTSVFAAQLALQGVVEEQRVGQRTTLDVLDQQRELVSAQIELVQAQREKDVAAFSVLSAIGRLSAQRLKLGVEIYRPSEHTRAVRDKWYGWRTPDGR